MLRPFRLRATILLTAVAVAAMVIPAGQPALAQQQTGPADGEAASQRIARLEEQIVDLQVVVGTLQSLAHRGPIDGGPGQAGTVASSPSAPAGAFSDSDMASRVDALETQIRALTGQIQQMTEEIARLQGQGGAVPQSGGPVYGYPPSGGDSSATTGRAPGSGYQSPPSFGTTTVTPWQAHPNPQPQVSPAPPHGNGGQDARATTGRDAAEHTAALPGNDAKTLYEQAYGELMQRDYESAEKSFKRMLESYPNDDLAGNAQYWLGETYFVRGKYREAANAFLAGYRNYSDGSKASDSLLRLGMALGQLGEHDAACNSFAELTSKFPDAPQHVRQKAAAESRRNGC